MSQPPYHAISLSQLPLIEVEALPASVRGVHTMMSLPERSLLYTLARNHYTGRGSIVDAGIFLGGSTVCFAQGVRDSNCAGPERPVVAFDQALVTPGMQMFFQRRRIHQDLELGHDLRPVIRDNTASFESMIEFHFGDILTESWAPERPIEICFLDILKTPEINRFAVRNFYPAFLPGATYLVQQDYFYHRLPYIKIYQEYLAPYFDYVGMVRTSAVFRLREAIPDRELSRDLYRELSRDELRGLHRQSETRAATDVGRQFMCALSRVELEYELDEIEKARDLFDHVQIEYRDLLDDDSSGHSAKILREVKSLL